MVGSSRPKCSMFCVHCWLPTITVLYNFPNLLLMIWEASLIFWKTLWELFINWPYFSSLKSVANKWDLLDPNGGKIESYTNMIDQRKTSCISHQPVNNFLKLMRNNILLGILPWKYYFVQILFFQNNFCRRNNIITHLFWEFIF